MYRRRRWDIRVSGRGIRGNVSAEQVTQALRDEERASDQIVTPYTYLVVDTGRHKVLVDTGMGSLPPGFPPTTGLLMSNLHEAGIEPATIDTVIPTHGHADHIGGNILQGAPAFPRARYVMGRSEWTYWTSEPSLTELTVDDEIKGFLRAWAQMNLMPLRDRMDLIDGDGEIVPGIRAIAAPGHTPGHMALAIESDGDILLDLVDTAQVVASRDRRFDRAAEAMAKVLYYHLPFPGLGRVARAGGGWRWEPAGAA